jgi:hypothetical protein
LMTISRCWFDDLRQSRDYSSFGSSICSAPHLTAYARRFGISLQLSPALGITQ